MIALIAAKSRNNIIGKKGELPWRLSADLARFRALTKGYPVVMGRKTYESIVTARGGPLPDRTNIVLVRTGELLTQSHDTVVVHSIDEALMEARKHGTDTWIIGGGEIYRQALPFADHLYLTEVDIECEGDTYFPEYDPDEWKEVIREPHPADNENEFPYTFVVLTRK